VDARRLWLLAALALAPGAPRGAGAALLTLSGGTLTVQVGPYAHVFSQNAPSILVSASSAGGFVEPAGIFTGTIRVPTTGLFTAVTPFTIAGLSNLTKSIAPGAGSSGHATGLLRPGGGLGGPGPLQGEAIVNVLGLFNLVVPLEAVGVTGGTAQYPAGFVAVTVAGTGWTTGAVTITGITTRPPSGAPVNTVTFGGIGYDNRTPLHNGVIALVSPFKVSTNAVGNLPGFALQTLTFSGGVPEPGTLALLGTAFAALALRGWAARVRSRCR
jgi:hypothetical protein